MRLCGLIKSQIQTMWLPFRCFFLIHIYFSPSLLRRHKSRSQPLRIKSLILLGLFHMDGVRSFKASILIHRLLRHYLTCETFILYLRQIKLTYTLFSDFYSPTCVKVILNANYVSCKNLIILSTFVVSLRCIDSNSEFRVVVICGGKTCVIMETTQGSHSFPYKPGFNVI